MITETPLKGLVAVGPGTRVKLKFTLKMHNGDVIDGTGDQGAELDIGDGKLLPGFERAMFGMQAGHKAALAIAAQNGFGLHNAASVQRIKKSQFQANMALSEGLMMSFADAQNAELPGIITRVEDQYVEVDFNHPLAGSRLIFEVHILSVEQLGREILRVS